MNYPYQIEVHDDLISKEVQLKLWNYVQDLSWHHVWLHPKRHLTHYRPSEGPSWFIERGMISHSSMHRSLLASDEASLKKLHLPVYALWKELQRKLNGRFNLTGLPEDMYDEETPVPATADPTLETGWRAYVNASHNTNVLGYGYIHRDSPIMDTDRYVTMLYFLNLEWYPSWGAELRYYPDDVNNETGDHQQHNHGKEQQRDFGIGWLDQGKTVSPKPGRLLIYDGRCLHATGPSNNSDITYPSIKIAFRAERVS